MVWETPFDVSMLKYCNVIIHCPSEELADELFLVFSENGLRWQGRESMSDTCWDVCKKETCYRVTDQRTICYGSMKSYSRERCIYRRYTKCTFYGVDAPDFDVASEDEILQFLSPREE